MKECSSNSTRGKMQSSVKPNPRSLRRVLVVDDDLVSLSLTALLLESEGLDVQQKSSGESACHDPLPEGWRPDLILTDLRMPGLHGAALAQQLRLRWPGATRVAMSAAAPSPVTGYAAILQKPLPMQGLKALLEDICHAEQWPLAQPSLSANRTGRYDDLPALDEAIFIKLKSSMQTAALREFIEVMLADAGRRIELIREAIRSGNAATAKREAHTLRGAAGMAGALALKEAARTIEVEVDSLDDLKREFARLEAEHRRVSVILAS